MNRNSENRYRILIADDDPTIQRLLRDFLNNLGYEVASVMDGCRAITELEKNRYDLLLSDIVMPCMDGIDLIRSVRSTDRYKNLSIILLSCKSDTATKVNAFDVLVDDYVTKPFDFDELAARIKTQMRLKHLQAEIEEKNFELLNRNFELEGYLDIARRFQRRMLPLDIKDIYGLKISSFYRPVDKVGGDMFDIIPFKNGKVGVFIGDVSGHGIAAAFLNIILKMTLQTALRDEIQPNKVIEKINSVIQIFMSDDNFITAAYTIFDTNNKLLYIASAGHPNGIIMRARYKKIETIDCTGLCIGVMDDVNYSPKLARLYPGDRVIFYTDGVIETKNKKGAMLGTKGLCEIAERCAGAQDVDKTVSDILDEIYRFSSGMEFEDDVTILCVEMLDSFHYSWTTRELNVEDALNILIKPLTSLYCTNTKDFKKVKTALYEALTNAIDHGNLEIPSPLLDNDTNDTSYEKLKQELIANPAYSKKRVTVKYLVEDKRIIYYISDDGNGFDHRHIADPTSPENIKKRHGRGISLIKMCMDEVSFNEKGNEIMLVKNLSK